MDKDTSLWAIGLLCSFIGALLLILLKLVLDTMKQTGTKIDTQGLAIVRIETTLGGENGVVAKVNRMHDDRSKAQLRELEATIMENAELREKYDEMVRERGGRRASDG